jgi:ABC-type glycerol-3-phosphate transport system permease component
VTPVTSASGGESPEKDNRLIYAGVVLVEVLVLVSIWLFQRYFGT